MIFWLAKVSSFLKYKMQNFHVWNIGKKHAQSHKLKRNSCKIKQNVRAYAKYSSGSWRLQKTGDQLQHSQSKQPHPRSFVYQSPVYWVSSHFLGTIRNVFLLWLWCNLCCYVILTCSFPTTNLNCFVNYFTYVGLMWPCVLSSSYLFSA